MCVLFCFCFLNNSIYKVTSGSFVCTVCYWDRLGTGQVHTQPAEGTTGSRQACLPLCGWSPPSQVLPPQTSGHLPDADGSSAQPPFCPWAPVRLNGHLSPPATQKEETESGLVFQAFVERKKVWGLCTREKGNGTCTKRSRPLYFLLGAEKKLAGD